MAEFIRSFGEPGFRGGEWSLPAPTAEQIAAREIAADRVLVDEQEHLAQAVLRPILAPRPDPHAPGQVGADISGLDWEFYER